jgi:hypothetical protein
MSTRDFAIYIELPPPPFVRVTDLDGQKHWIPADMIQSMHETARGTELRYAGDEILMVREHGSDILFGVKRTIVVELVRILR